MRQRDITVLQMQEKVLVGYVTGLSGPMQYIREPGSEAGKFSSQAHELDQCSMLQRIFSSLTQKRDFQGANSTPVPNSDGSARLPDASGLVFVLRDVPRSPHFILRSIL